MSGFIQLEEYLRNVCKQALDDTAREFKRGNFDGLDLSKSAFSAARVLFDDEDTVLIWHTVLVLSDEWLEDEMLKEGGKGFLSELGNIISELSNAYASRRRDTIDSIMRKYVMTVHKRLKESPTLLAVETSH